MTQRPKILLTNDDGVGEPGIEALREALEDLAEVLVVAPLSQRSGSGCGLTVGRAIEVRDGHDGRARIIALDGTPVDCVKFAASLGNFHPDLVVSGINAGINAGNSVFYSGTVAAAVEAAMLGQRGLAVSLATWTTGDECFETAAHVVRGLLPWLLEKQWQPRTYWNLNVPSIPREELRGVRYAAMGDSRYVDKWSATPHDDGRVMVTNYGTAFEPSSGPDHSDDLLVAEGWAALSLLKLDLSVELPAMARKALELQWAQRLAEAMAPEVIQGATPEETA
jgi:5'-nucleotidase